MKRISIRFKANKTGLSLVSHRSESANLHVKRIKKEANIPFSANIFYFFRFEANILEQNEANIFNKNRLLIES